MSLKWIIEVKIKVNLKLNLKVKVKIRLKINYRNWGVFKINDRG